MKSPVCVGAARAARGHAHSDCCCIVRVCLSFLELGMMSQAQPRAVRLAALIACVLLFGGRGREVESAEVSAEVSSACSTLGHGCDVCPGDGCPGIDVPVGDVSCGNIAFRRDVDCHPVPVQDSWDRGMKIVAERFNVCVCSPPPPPPPPAYHPPPRPPPPPPPPPPLVVPDTSGEGDWCANEGERCYCPGGHVRYGVNTSWAAEPDGRTDEFIRCADDVFGDPARGDAKTCECNTPAWQSFVNFVTDPINWVELAILGMCVCTPIYRCHRYYHGYDRDTKFHRADNTRSAVTERKERRQAGCCWRNFCRWCCRCRNPNKRSGTSITNNQEYLLATYSEARPDTASLNAPAEATSAPADARRASDVDDMSALLSLGRDSLLAEAERLAGSDVDAAGRAYAIAAARGASQADVDASLERAKATIMTEGERLLKTDPEAAVPVFKKAMQCGATQADVDASLERARAAIMTEGKRLLKTDPKAAAPVLKKAMQCGATQADVDALVEQAKAALLAEQAMVLSASQADVDESIQRAESATLGGTAHEVQAPSLAQPTPPLASTASDLTAALRGVQLLQYEEGLRELGCTDAADLVEVREEELLQLGMKRIEAKRLMRHCEVP